MVESSCGEVVFIVLDPCYGARLHDLPAIGPVWAVLSPVNEPVIRQLWMDAKSSPLHDRITGIRVKTDHTAAMYLVEELDTILLHHPLCTQIDIVAAEVGLIAEKVLQDAGFAEITPTAYGFRAARRSSL